MIHILYGDGKGKTSAAAGMALRAASYGVRVIFAQFLKDGSSGEIALLKEIPGVMILKATHFFGFTKNMTQEQAGIVSGECRELLEKIRCYFPGADEETRKADISALIVMDEVLNAVDKGLLETGELISFLEDMPEKAELVMTGRKADPELIRRSDYVSEVKKERHPYENGVRARTGVEK